LLDEKINKTSVDTANKAVEKTLQSIWENDQEFFYRQPENKFFTDVDDSGELKNKAELAAFHMIVENNMPRFRGKASNLELLKASKAEYDKRFGRAGTKAADPEKKEDDKPPAGKKPVIPVTLGGLPTAQAEIMGDEFSYLKALDPVAKEEAIEKMKPEQYERYLKGK